MLKKFWGSFFSILVLTGFLTAPWQTTKAGLLAIDTADGTDGIVGDFFAGFSRGNPFSLSQSFTVDGLGYFDVGSDGLLESHDVGIYTSAGVLVVGAVTITSASALVPSLSTLGDWRFEAVTPVTLGPGDYVIAGYDLSGIDEGLQDGVFTDIPEVTRDPAGFDFIASAGLAFPTNPLAFDITVVSFSGNVPEPTTLALMGLGLAVIGWRRKTSFC